MTKISEHDLVRESVPVQEFAEETKNILNKGAVEFEVTAASQPAYTAPEETKIVLSIFGGQYRLYISYLGDWYYSALTKI